MPATRPPADDTVPDRLATRAAERPDEVALTLVDGDSLTFAEWHDRASRVAHGLMANGIAPGDRVLVACSTVDWTTYAVAYIGVQRAGATAVPVLRTLGEEHIRQVCAASEAVGVLGATDGVPPGLWSADVADLVDHSPATPVAVPAGPGDDAEILYTSGTTGVPKGVVASHANLLFTHSTRPRHEGTKVVLHAVPPGSLAGQGLLLQPLDATRHRIVTLTRFDPASFLDAVERFDVTDVVLVPALALTLLEHAGTRRFDSVRAVRTMSAPIPPVALQKLAAMFPQAAISNLYTTTEAWPARTRIRFDPARPDSVGRSEGTGAVRITDADGAVAPPGTDGNVELRLSGAPRRRYVDDRGATDSVFLPDGWVRTGDIGRVDDDGYLYLVDRNADLVISGGLNVSTIEVEAAIQEFSGVAEAAAFGLPHRLLGEYVVAAVRPGVGYDRAALNAFLVARLGPIKAPKRVLEVADFPRNAMGKIVKRALRDQLTREHDAARRTDSGAGPETVEAQSLQRFWADALGAAEVPWTISFVELGGTSLSAMEIVGRVRSELRRQVSQRDLFEVSDLREFVSLVAGAPEAEQDDSLAPIRRVRRG
ncbi:MAG TPA: AMP-binding protein [Actinophytocola sp.]|uniref:AMP-binding protein n=1 Tax=Actinophytocola sp. TaxID=1872138 RepID=UPI002F93510A